MTLPGVRWGHDILDERLEPQLLWELPEVTHTVRRQLDDWIVGLSRRQDSGATG